MINKQQTCYSISPKSGIIITPPFISYVLMIDQILQFKISLKHSKPPIWRRVQIPSDSTFEDLHLIIQRAMGWCNEHLHDFCIQKDKNSEPLIFGVPSEDDFGTAETNTERDGSVENIRLGLYCSAKN